ncbi:hypothetical protein HaLaN_14878, partial [Haematococcus lacustris]
MRCRWNGGLSLERRTCTATMAATAVAPTLTLGCLVVELLLSMLVLMLMAYSSSKTQPQSSIRSCSEHMSDGAATVGCSQPALGPSSG